MKQTLSISMRAKKIRSIKHIWKNMKNNESDTISEISSNILNSFDQRHDKLYSRLNFHDCTNLDLNKYNNLKKEYLQHGGHSADHIVVLEAHDLGLNIDLILVAGDKGMYQAVNKTTGFSFKD